MIPDDCLYSIFYQQIFGMHTMSCLIIGIHLGDCYDFNYLCIPFTNWSGGSRLINLVIIQYWLTIKVELLTTWLQVYYITLVHKSVWSLWTSWGHPHTDVRPTCTMYPNMVVGLWPQEKNNIWGEPILCMFEACRWIDQTTGNLNQASGEGITPNIKKEALCKR